MESKEKNDNPKNFMIDDDEIEKNFEKLQLSDENKNDDLTPIGIFWDIENCRIRKGLSFLSVAQYIRKKFLEKHWEAEFSIVCDVLKEPTKLLREISDSQVTLIHCSSMSKNAADEKLKQMIRKFADVHKSNCCVLLISNDVNFAGDLFSLRYRKKFYIILVHSAAVSKALLLCANENYSFDTFLDNCDPLVIGDPTSNESVDLFVENLPISVRLGLLKYRLGRLSENCGGKVVSVERNFVGCQAVIRFPNSNYALRAQQRMDGEIVYGNRISLQNNNPYVRSTAEAVISSNNGNNNGSGLIQNQRSTSLVARRNIPYNRYSAYPQQTRSRAPLLGRDSVVSNDFCSISSDFEAVNNSNHNNSSGWSKSSASMKMLASTPQSLRDISVMSPVDMLVTNLDSSFHPQSMKQTLLDLFKNYAMVLNMSVTIQSEGNMIAHVRVANMQDAQFAISKLQRIKVGFKRISIQFAPERIDLGLLRSQIVIMLQEVPGNRLPLFKFLELFKARFRTTISLSTLYKLRDVCVINDDLYGKIKSRFISLLPKYQVVSQQKMTTNNTFNELETWYCTVHYTAPPNEKGWAELDSIKLPNIMMALSEFSRGISVLLDTHNGNLPLYSLNLCYAAEIGNLRTDEQGVPLEHYVTCVSDVELCVSINRVKYLKWSKKINCDESDVADSECSQKSAFNNTPLAIKMSLLSRELIDLLKTIPKCRLPLSKFIPAYHHHFGRQCRVADYGYTKLDDLLDALTHVIQVIGEGESRLLTLNHQTQMKRFTYDLLKVLKFQKNKQILYSEFASTFERIVNKKFDPIDYGLCSLKDLLSNMSKNVVIVTPTIDCDDIISVPKKEQTPEEIMRTKHFALEAVELLRHMPQCTLLFRKFVTAYHHHFGRQCRLSDYGFTKLIELFESIPDVVRIDDTSDLDKKIALTLPYHIRIVGEQLVNIIRSLRFSKIPLDSIANAYLKEYGYGLQPEAFDCHSIDELILKLSDFVQILYEESAIYVTVNDGTRIEQLILRVWSVLINVPHCLPTFIFLKEYFRKHNNSFELCQLHELNSVIHITHAGQSKIMISLTPFYVMLAKIYWLLYDCGGSILLSEFENKYYQKYQEHLYPFQFGVQNLQTLLNKMIHVIVLKDKRNPVVYLSSDLKAFNVDLPERNNVQTTPMCSTQESTNLMSTNNELLNLKWNYNDIRRSSFPPKPDTPPPFEINWSPSNSPDSSVNITVPLPPIQTPKLHEKFENLYSPAKGLMSAYYCPPSVTRNLNNDFNILTSTTNPPDPSHLPHPDFFN